MFFAFLNFLFVTEKLTKRYEFSIDFFNIIPYHTQDLSR